MRSLRRRIRRLSNGSKSAKKLAAPHLPPTLTQLERAVKRAHSAYHTAERAYYDARPAARDAGGITADEERRWTSGQSPSSIPADADALGAVVDDLEDELDAEGR